MMQQLGGSIIDQLFLSIAKKNELGVLTETYYSRILTPKQQIT